MKIARRLLIVTLVAVAFISNAQNVTQAADYLAELATMECDKANQSRWLLNRHEFRTIEVVVRWRAEGGKTKTDRLFIPPGEQHVVGCAAEKIEIVEARFTDF